MKEITAGKGARLILDPVGGPDLEKLGEAAARDATIFLFGSLSEQPNAYPAAGWGKGLSSEGLHDDGIVGASRTNGES